MAMKITPDAQLATPEAIKNRIAQLEKELAAATDPVSTRSLPARIAALKSRLAIGAEKTAANPALLKSKNDMR